MLKPEYLKILREIFDLYCPDAQILAYGSRVKNEAHDGSDLDLAIRNFNSQKVSLYKLREILNDSNIPFLIDIQEFDSLPQSFQDEIEKNYVVIYG